MDLKSVQDFFPWTMWLELKQSNIWGRKQDLVKGMNEANTAPSMFLYEGYHMVKYMVKYILRNMCLVVVMTSYRSDPDHNKNACVFHGIFEQ